jgi:MSHA pilin protein MshD
VNTAGATLAGHGIARRGLTLIEGVVSMLIMSVLLVAALNTVGVSQISLKKMGDRSRGVLLAQQLMAEILRQDYEEPDDVPGFGREASEDSAGGRARYDDVDDYNGWTAMPPEYKDGSEIPNLPGWRRKVAVTWANPTNLAQSYGAEGQTKRIAVAVTRNDVPVAELVAVKTVGLPPPSDALALLLVVTDESNPTDQELARQVLMASWGFNVSLISASAPEAKFDSAVAEADAAYVSEQINPTDLGTKLTDAQIGVVNEEVDLHLNLGFSEYRTLKTSQQVDVADNTHYITTGFDLALLPLFSSDQPVHMIVPTLAPGLRVLARTERTPGHFEPSLAILEEGDDLYGGGVAAGRRVQLPWGADAFDFSALNEDGKTIMKRAIEWAANREESP